MTKMVERDKPTRPRRSQKFARSRNGCATCKLHRRKCDEARPECENCVSRNVPCPGYDKAFKWSSKYQQPEVQLQFQNGSSRLKARPSTKKDDSAVRTGGSNQSNISEQAIFTTGQEVGTYSQFHAVVVPATCTPKASSTWTVEEDDTAEAAVTEIAHIDEEENEEEHGAEDRTHSCALTVSGYDRYQGRKYHESKELLRRYYGIMQPSPQYLSHQATVLTEHYFKEVCGLYSTFDSRLNPFRSSVARFWSHSAPVYYAIQSMAAAHLSNSNAEMERVGFEMKKQADLALQQGLQQLYTGQENADCLLMTTLLLGLSACWHSVGDLGLSYLRMARYLIRPRLTHSWKDDDGSEMQNQFFCEALIYWEMMIAFVASQQDAEVINPTERISASVSIEKTLDQPCNVEAIIPHPWTGVCPKAQMLFAETARLVRTERTMENFQLFDHDVDFMNMVRRECHALELEEQLLTLEPPNESTIIDHGDLRTSKEDLITIAEATKFAALLELYQVFPSILRKRLQLQGTGDRMHENDLGGTADSLADDGKSAEVDFLNSLAVHTLQLVEQLPPNSGTRFLQLIIIVIAATKLRTKTHEVNLDFYDLAPKPLDPVITSREFTVQRLHAHISRLPAKPVKRCLELIQEVWRLLDAGENAVWLDVMFSRGWQTIMG